MVAVAVTVLAGVLSLLLLSVVVQSWTKVWRQTDEIKQNRFFYGMFYS